MHLSDVLNKVMHANTEVGVGRKKKKDFLLPYRSQQEVTAGGETWQLHKQRYGLSTESSERM